MNANMAISGFEAAPFADDEVPWGGVARAHDVNHAPTMASVRT